MRQMAQGRWGRRRIWGHFSDKIIDLFFSYSKRTKLLRGPLNPRELIIQALISVLLRRAEKSHQGYIWKYLCQGIHCLTSANQVSFTCDSTKWVMNQVIKPQTKYRTDACNIHWWHARIQLSLDDIDCITSQSRIPGNQVNANIDLEDFYSTILHSMAETMMMLMIRTTVIPAKKNCTEIIINHKKQD